MPDVYCIRLFCHANTVGPIGVGSEGLATSAGLRRRRGGAALVAEDRRELGEGNARGDESGGNTAGATSRGHVQDEVVTVQSPGLVIVGQLTFGLVRLELLNVKR